jgi:deoxyribodipyrimidine photolyase
MTITVRLDAAPDGAADLAETLRMAVGLALGEATVQVVFTAAGREWWDAAHAGDAALRQRLDELKDALEAVGAALVGLEGESAAAPRRAVERFAASDLLINSVGRLVPEAVGSQPTV